MPGIILIYKTTFLQSHGNPHLEEKLRTLAPELWQQMQAAHTEHLRAVERFIRVLEKEDLPFAAYERSEDAGNLDRADLVITLGGDGTFIHASHHLKTTPLLGINSVPQHSIGHYCLPCPTDEESLAHFLHHVFAGRMSRVTYPRLELILDGQPMGLPILNDILICDAIPAAVSRYLLRYHDGKTIHSEIQKSSGIWIATRSGASAAYSSALGPSFPPANERERLCAFVVREIYDREHTQTRNAFLPQDTLSHFAIISAMAQGRIFIDGSHKMLEFLPGSHLQLRWFAYDLVAISPDLKARQ